LTRPIEVVWFDADGVLIDSREAALEAWQQVLGSIGREAPICGTADLERLFDDLGPDQARLLRDRHRSLMRHRATALGRFDAVLDWVRRLAVPRHIVTSALADGVRLALGPDAALFGEIVGFEVGPKSRTLPERVPRDRAVYVTDTAFDAAICRGAGMPVIGVGWGYDDIEALGRAGAEYLVSRTEDLGALFASLGLILPESAGA
jgi:phosphoglycolate phosphatase-like HAD superfamily hydrolase